MSFTENDKIVIDVPCVVDVKVHILSFNMILISSPKRVPTPSYPFLEKYGKGSFTVKLKSLREVP